MKKVIILGTSGMLGSMVLDYLSTKSDIKLTGTIRNKALFNRFKTKYKNVKFSLRPLNKISLAGFDYIINCIGIIPQKSDDPQEMILFNSLLPYSIIKRAPNTRIIQISTDCVFSGTRGEYSEKDNHDDCHVYGKTKSLGEVSAKNFFNIRTSVVGPDRASCVSLLEWFLSQKKNAVIKGYKNHLWNGITTLHFAKLCHAIIDKNRKIPGTLHFIPADAVSKYDLLKIFSKCFGRDDVIIKKFNEKTAINRTLSTTYKKVNDNLWKDMGYNRALPIDRMIQELKEYVKERDFYK